MQADALRIKLARFGGGSARGTPISSNSRGGAHLFNTAFDSRDTSDSANSRMQAWCMPSEPGTVSTPMQPVRPEQVRHEQVRHEQAPLFDQGSDAGTEVSAKWAPPPASMCEAENEDEQAVLRPLDANKLQDRQTRGPGSYASAHSNRALDPDWCAFAHYPLLLQGSRCSL